MPFALAKLRVVWSYFICGIEKNAQGCQLGTHWNIKVDILKMSFQQKNLVHTPCYAYPKFWGLST